MEHTDRFNVDNPPPDDAFKEKKVYPKSFSSLKMYRQCSLQWRFVKFDKIPRQPAAWLPQGTAFHACDEAWERSDRTLPEMHLRELYYESFDSELAKYKEEVPDLSQWLTVGRTSIQNDITNRRERGWDQFVVYKNRAEFESWRVWRLPDDSPAVEISFNLDIGFGPIRGYVDKIKEWPTGQLTLCDTKTGNREETALQLGVYALAVNQLFDLDIRFGEWYYAKDDTWSKQIDLGDFTVDYVAEQFLAMERGVENKVFFANPGKHCALCPAKGICLERNSIN